jgi:hypothetical protein
MIITLGLMLYYGVPRETISEPKNEPKLEPTYKLSYIDAVTMLRNAEVQKRGK